QRPPDRATIAARFVPALHVNDEPEVVARLLELARPAEGFVRHGNDHLAPRHNLPIQLNSFIGREKEMAEVQRLLTTNRLTTLTGAGGSGKTRLSLEVAHALLDVFTDGVWFIELAPLSDPTLVLPTVAATQGLRDIPGQPLDKALADVLRPKSVLLVLDNCEHVIQACAELAETLLRACPNLKLLATSREALNIAGETVFSVPSLSLPDTHHSVDASAVAQSEAVRLFVDRALAVKPDFRVTEVNAATIAQICQRLDGIPLALELAAARMRALSLEQIAARLDDRFRLLTGGSRTALRRHQTLTALMDWSYDLLSDAERVVLRRLAVFWGGWTLEAAEPVCAGEDIEAAEVLNLLTHLVDKSLVVVEEHNGATRYGLLETVHEYALKRLIESGELEAVQEQHVNFFLALAEKLKLTDSTWGVWLKPFMAEHDNLRAALDWAFESDLHIALRLTEVFGPFWFHSGYLSEGRSYLMRALELTETMGSPQTRIRVLQAAGGLAGQQGDDTTVRLLCEETATLCREIGDMRGLAYALGGLGNLEESVAIMREFGDKGDLATMLFYLGASVAASGDDTRARALQEESVALYQELGDRTNIASPLGYLGYMALRQGNYTAARSLFEESLALARGWHKWGIAWRLEGFAALAVKEEEPERAARLYGAAQALPDSGGARLDPIDRLGYDQYVATTREQLGEGAFTQVWAEGRMMTMEQAIAYALREIQPD
ncbi:MAG: ATP-binding protein, partial [Anaerolineales bacterium]